MNRDEIIVRLRAVPLFSELDDAGLSEIAGLTRHRTYPAYQTLFHAGDSGHTLYVILAGQVRIEKVSESGEAVFLADRQPGEHFGELSLLDGSPRMATAGTLTPCECLTIEREAFQHCLLHTPAVALSVMVSLAKRLRDAADTLEAVQGLDVLGRLCRALLELCPDGGSLQVTHQDLADRIGATRESVTRALGGLKKSGLVGTAGRTLLLLDLPALRRRCAL